MHAGAEQCQVSTALGACGALLSTHLKHAARQGGGSIREREQLVRAEHALGIGVDDDANVELAGGCPIHILGVVVQGLRGIKGQHIQCADGAIVELRPSSPIALSN